MSLKRLKSIAAFTLMEMVIYIAIFSVLMTSLVGVLMYSDKSNKIALQQQIIQNTKIFLQSHFQNSFSNTHRIDNPTISNQGNSTELTLVKLGKLSSVQSGTGIDGQCTISTSINLNTSSCSGKSNPDSPYTTSTVITNAGASSITVQSIPSGMNLNDEILIINLKGTSSDNSNVGNYETKYISSVSSNTINLNSSLQNTYDGTTQKIMVQRIPNYTNVIINSGGTMTANAWDGTKNGVLYFRATGTVNINNGGSIDMSAKGYLGQISAYNQYTSGPGIGGETYNGYGYNGCNWNGTYLCPDDSEASSYGLPHGHEGGGGGSSNGGSIVNGSIGGGGGGGGWNFSYTGGYGGGGGYGTVGSGANNGNGSTGGNGGSSLINQAGNGGGGGTYGTSDLTKIYMGSAGGYGDATGGSSCTSSSCKGGNGGGIIGIFAGTVNVNSGSSLLCNGANSTNGGGGAAGSILIKADNVSLGSSSVYANGGTSHYSGGSGRIAVYYTTTDTGGSSPFAFSYSVTPKTTNTDILQYYDYQLIGNQLFFYNGSVSIPSPCTSSLCKPLTDPSYIKVVSMSFSLLKNLSGANVGARVSIVLQGNYYTNVQGTLQTEFSL